MTHSATEIAMFAFGITATISMFVAALVRVLYVVVRWATQRKIQKKGHA